MSAGHLRQRSAGSWELRWRAGGRTFTRTVKGGKREAEKALRAALVLVDKGQHVEPTRATLGQFILERLALWPCGGSTREHYEQLGRLITAHLGSIALQRLSTRDIERWHRDAAVAPSTLKHAHGLLVRVLSDAQRHKMLTVNVAKEQPPPRAPASKVKVPTEDLIAPMLEKLRGTEFHVPVTLTLNTGLRRSEMLALRWSDVGLDKASLTVTRSLEETASGGISIKGPKTESGERAISLPAAAVEALREHRRQAFERCLLLGTGRPPESALLFPGMDGQPQSPRAFSLRWLRTVRRLSLPPVTWHGLRHVHCSLLLRHGVDIVTVSNRLGHSRIETTARVYAHAIAKDDRHAAAAMEKALGQ